MFIYDSLSMNCFYASSLHFFSCTLHSLINLPLFTCRTIRIYLHKIHSLCIINIGKEISKFRVSVITPVYKTAQFTLPSLTTIIRCFRLSLHTLILNIVHTSICIGTVINTIYHIMYQLPNVVGFWLRLYATDIMQLERFF